MLKKTTLLTLCALACPACSILLSDAPPSRDEWADAPADATCKAPPAATYFDFGLGAIFTAAVVAAGAEGDGANAIFAAVLAGTAAGSGLYGFYNQRACDAFKDFQGGRLVNPGDPPPGSPPAASPQSARPPG